MEATSFNWLAFFQAAGIPPTHSKSYAEVFEDNRMREDMLPELDREVLADLGVAVMGDVLAILKQAKVNTNQAALSPCPTKSAHAPCMDPPRPTWLPKRLLALLLNEKREPLPSLLSRK